MLHIWVLEFFRQLHKSDSTVGIATGYGLDNIGDGVQVLVGSRIFTSPRRPDCLWGCTQPPILWVPRAFFLSGKTVGAWSWPLTSNYCQGQENFDLYIHSPIWLHGVVLNYLNTGTTLIFTQKWGKMPELLQYVYISQFVLLSLALCIVCCMCKILDEVSTWQLEWFCWQITYVESRMSMRIRFRYWKHFLCCTFVCFSIQRSVFSLEHKESQKYHTVHLICVHVL
jgi:hypothetical protein